MGPSVQENDLSKVCPWRLQSDLVQVREGYAAGVGQTFGRVCEGSLKIKISHAEEKHERNGCFLSIYMRFSFENRLTSNLGPS